MDPFKKYLNIRMELDSIEGLLSAVEAGLVWVDKCEPVYKPHEKRNRRRQYPARSQDESSKEDVLRHALRMSREEPLV